MNTKLSESDREESRAGVGAVFCNPFDPGWARGMAEFAGLPAGSARLRVVEAICDRIRGLLDRHGGVHPAWNGFPESDAELLRILGLYLAYVELIDPLDRLIGSGGEGELHGWWPAFRHTDLGAAEAAGFVASFYQFRRAYLFLSQRLAGGGEAVEQLRFRCWQTLFGADIRWYVRRLWDRLDDCPVLLTGPTGTGKSRVARILGESGFIPFVDEGGLARGGRGHFAFRFSDATVPVVIPEYPESLIESALFGHRKGAFTGADRDVPGVFGQCRAHGIAFLDEIGDIAPPVQTKLLRLLQERRYSPVGSTEDRAFAGRVVAATHRDLIRLRQEGRFRDDLFFRVCSLEIPLPTLRDRLDGDPDELGRLVGRILEAWLGGPDPHLGEEVVEALKRSLPPDYAWPGNIRELEQAVRRCCLSGSYRGEGSGSASPSPDAWAQVLQGPPRSAREVMASYCAWLYRETGNYSEVARLTGLDRRTVKAYIQAE